MVRDVALLLAGAVVYGIGTHCFVTPADIAPGGAMGIALMISHLTGLPVGILTLLKMCIRDRWRSWAAAATEPSQARSLRTPP